MPRESRFKVTIIDDFKFRFFISQISRVRDTIVRTRTPKDRREDTAFRGLKTVIIAAIRRDSRGLSFSRVPRVVGFAFRYSKKIDKRAQLWESIGSINSSAQGAGIMFQPANGDLQYDGCMNEYLFLGSGVKNNLGGFKKRGSHFWSPLFVRNLSSSKTNYMSEGASSLCPHFLTFCFFGNLACLFFCNSIRLHYLN